MRKAFHEELDRVAETLVEMTHLASSAMNRATTALLDADIQFLPTPSSPLTPRSMPCALTSTCSPFDLLACQQPVATDLRVIVTSMRMSSDPERMGDPRATWPRSCSACATRRPLSLPSLRSTILQMGHVAERIVEKAGSAIAARDLEAAQQIERDDDAMDDLHREPLRPGHRPESWRHGTEAAIDITLLGRYYERFVDHAVSVGHRAWLVAGEFDPASEGSHEDAEDGATVGA